MRALSASTNPAWPESRFLAFSTFSALTLLARLWRPRLLSRPLIHKLRRRMRQLVQLRRPGQRQRSGGRLRPRDASVLVLRQLGAPDSLGCLVGAALEDCT